MHIKYSKKKKKNQFRIYNEDMTNNSYINQQAIKIKNQQESQEEEEESHERINVKKKKYFHVLT